MSVKVKDLLALKLFNSAEIVAGKKGLNNEIKRINFSDCPIIDKDAEETLVLAGDFFINSLYIVMDTIDDMKDVFEYYVQNKSAGICVIKEFVKSIPKPIIDFANKNNFPVILIDGSVPYAEIIRTTTQMILLEQVDTISEMRIDRLLASDLSLEEVLLISSQINGVFRNYFSIVYIRSDRFNAKDVQSIRQSLNAQPDFETLKYRSGIVLILNYDKPLMLTVHLEYIKKVVDMQGKNYVIGVSNLFKAKAQFNRAIKQALDAYELSSILNQTIVYYKNLNIYKILFPIRHSSYIKEFYNEVFLPLFEHDKVYHSDMILTLETFLENDGDYKKTALQLHQHENTIRYRVLKAKKILDLESENIKFLEHISLAIKIHKLIDRT